MKRLVAALMLFSLVLTLFGCRAKDPDEPAPPDDPTVPDAAEPIVLEELRLEFVADGHDAQQLLDLKKELPALLISALAEQNVTVGTINITFGTSAAATADALIAGNVQLAWLPMETYLRYENQLLPAAELSGQEDAVLQLGLIVGEVNRSLLENANAKTALSSFSQTELLRASWALPANDETAEQLLALALADAYGDISVSDLTLFNYYTDEIVYPTEGGFLLRYHSGATDENTFFPLLELPVKRDMVAASQEDPITGSDAFLHALRNALAALEQTQAGRTALLYYSTAGYLEPDDSRYELSRRLLGLS